MAQLLSSNVTGTLNVAGSLIVTTQANIASLNVTTANANTLNVNTVIALSNTTAGLNLMGGLASSNGNLRLWANGVEFLRVTNTGVAIGTAQPNSNLVITGNVFVTTGANVSGTLNAVTGNITTLTTPTLSAPQVSTYNAGASVLPVANINYLGTSTVNVVAVANGSNQVNVSFAVNTTAVGSSATSPGGANQQMQFNNNGVIAGSANVYFNLATNTMTHATNTEFTNLFFNVATTGNGSGPLTLTANQAIVYARNVANQVMLFVENGRPNTSLFNDAYAISPSEISKVVSTCTPNTYGIANNTCFVTYGMFQATMNIVALTMMCNLANGIPTNTAPSLRNSMKRFQLGANANATTGNCTIFANSNTFWAGGTTTGNAGGYILRFRFSVDNYPPNTRIFVGVSNAVATMVNGATDVDPLSNTSNAWTIFGVGANGNTSAVAGNLFITYGVATSPRTIIDLGNQYTLVGNTGVYELTINCPPGGGWMGWHMRNLANGASNNGVVTTNVPQANLFMQPVAWLKSNTTTVSNLSIMKIYSETTG